MRCFIAACYCFFLVNFLNAQVGFNAAYFSQQIPDWEKAAFGNRSNESLLSSGYSGEIDYRILPFENLRIEFLPAVSYSFSNSTHTNNLGQRAFDLQQLDFK